MTRTGVVLALVLLAAPALGQELPDPWTGLSTADVERLAEEIRAGRDARALAEAQKELIADLMEQIEGLQEQVAALKDAEAKRALAVAIAEDRDKRRAENEAALLGIVEKYRGLVDAQAAVNAKAMERIDALERRSFWQTVLTGIVAILGLAALAL